MASAACDSKDSTFLKYTAEQAARYSEFRGAYPRKLYETLFAAHLARGGQLGRLLDVGCGTGKATVELAHWFNHATGIDASPGMIRAARAAGGKTGAGNEIEYEVRPAEEVDLQQEEGLRRVRLPVDVLTSAMAVSLCPPWAWFSL